MNPSGLFRRVFNVPWISHLLSLAAAGLYFLQSYNFAHHLDVTMDEGTYLMKGLLYIKGVYQPFQLYGPWTNKMPFAFYIPGLAQAVFEPGLRTGRYFSIFLGLLMCLGIWLVARRLGGSWWAAAAVGVTALNASNIATYSLAITQVLIACILAWTLVLILGNDRPLWQIALGATLASLAVMVRQNLAPLVVFVILYVWWQNGWRAALVAAISAILALGIVHILFWPYIMGIWTPFMPDFMSKWFAFIKIPLGGGTSTWDLQYGLLTKLFVFWEGIRFNFIAMIGVVAAILFWQRKKAWRSDTHFKIAVSLTILYLLLIAIHLYASVGKTYCVFCFAGYMDFFNLIGLIILVVSFSSWARKPGWFRQILAVLTVLISAVGIGFGSYQKTADAVLNITVPRIRDMKILPGSTELWRLLTNKFSWSFDFVQQLLPAIAGLMLGLLLLVVVGIYFIITRKQTHRWNYGSAVLLIFLAAGFLLTPTPILGGSKNSELCGSDIIASHEAAGRHLANLVPPGSLVYWENDVSPLPLLYIPEVRIYPAQLNHWYSYLQGGDPQQLLKAGFWNAELALQWKEQADYLLIADRYTSKFTTSDLFLEGNYDELPPSPSVVECRNRAIIHIFRRVK